MFLIQSKTLFMCQFLLGTVQQQKIGIGWSLCYHSKLCQFLLGTVQQVILHVNPEELEAEYVSIPLRYGTTLDDTESFKCFIENIIEGVNSS
jgi:hypothetical protein